jgi:hypothetical protein
VNLPIFAAPAEPERAYARIGPTSMAKHRRSAGGNLYFEETSGMRAEQEVHDSGDAEAIF